jgi:hypothetical protein
MTAPRLWDGPKERRGKPPLHLPASAGMGRVVRGKRSTTPSPRGESLPRPTSRGGAEDPPLAPVPFAQSYPWGPSPKWTSGGKGRTRIRSRASLGMAGVEL